MRARSLALLQKLLVLRHPLRRAAAGDGVALHVALPRHARSLCMLLCMLRCRQRRARRVDFVEHALRSDHEVFHALHRRIQTFVQVSRARPALERLEHVRLSQEVEQEVAKRLADKERKNK